MKSVSYYGKEVELNGQQELVEVSLSETRMKAVEEQEWSTFLKVHLKLVDMEDEEALKQLSGEEMVQRFELLRDCWLELADGLLMERDK